MRSQCTTRTARVRGGRARAFVLPAVLLALVAVGSARAGGDVAASDWIERVNGVLLPGRSMTARGSLTTSSRSGTSKRVEFDFARLTEEDGTHRTLIEVQSPPSRKGTVYQIVVRADGDLESWIWSPELGSLRPIIGVNRTDSFLGSTFTYEDLGLGMPRERRVGEVLEIVEDGKRWIAVDSAPYHYYARVRTYIDPETAMPDRVIFFDRAGQRYREQRFLELRPVGEHVFPAAMEVRNRAENVFSRLVFSDVRFDVEVEPSLYSESVIQQMLRRGERSEERR